MIEAPFFMTPAVDSTSLLVRIEDFHEYWDCNYGTPWYYPDDIERICERLGKLNFVIGSEDRLREIARLSNVTLLYEDDFDDYEQLFNLLTQYDLFEEMINRGIIEFVKLFPVYTCAICKEQARFHAECSETIKFAEDFNKNPILQLVCNECSLDSSWDTWDLELHYADMLMENKEIYGYTTHYFQEATLDEDVREYIERCYLSTHCDLMGVLILKNPNEKGSEHWFMKIIRDDNTDEPKFIPIMKFYRIQFVKSYTVTTNNTYIGVGKNMFDSDASVQEMGIKPISTTTHNDAPELGFVIREDIFKV